MRTTRMLVTVAGLLLAACGGSSSTDSKPGTPRDVSVAAGPVAGTAVVAFTPPESAGSSAITGYTVTVEPGGLTATREDSPILLTGLTPKTAYTYSVVATNDSGASTPATTVSLRLYDVVETFLEPMTQPNDSIFTGTFTFDPAGKVVSNLAGSLTESMTMYAGDYGPPMTTVALAYQLSAASVTLGGVDGLLVTTFALPTVNTFDPSGFAPGGSEYYGLGAGAPNPAAGGVGNAYSIVFVNTADPTAELVQEQIDRLAYADCTSGGMMMSTCMTGTTEAGYGTMGTMMGYPVSQVVTER